MVRMMPEPTFSITVRGEVAAPMQRLVAARTQPLMMPAEMPILVTLMRVAIPVVRVKVATAIAFLRPVVPTAGKTPRGKQKHRRQKHQYSPAHGFSLLSIG